MGNHNLSICRIVEPSPNGYVHKTLLHLRLRKQCGREESKYCKGQRIRQFAVKLWLLITSETILIKSHQHNHPSMSWARMTPESMPKWVRKISWGLNLPQRTIGIWGMLQVEGWSSQGRAHQMVVHCQMVCSENMPTSAYGLSRLYSGTYVYTNST